MAHCHGNSLEVIRSAQVNEALSHRPPLLLAPEVQSNRHGIGLTIAHVSRGAKPGPPIRECRFQYG
jgi:hypothetical protein